MLILRKSMKKKCTMGEAAIEGEDTTEEATMSEVEVEEVTIMDTEVKGEVEEKVEDGVEEEEEQEEEKMIQDIRHE